MVGGGRRSSWGRGMDGWMWRGKKGGSEALGRATQSRLQMCRQQQCGCFGPHQAALGVSPAHVPALPVNQPNQASGSTAATKPLRPDPQNTLASDRRTPTSPLCRVKPVIVSLTAYTRWNGLQVIKLTTLSHVHLFCLLFFLFFLLCLHACSSKSWWCPSGYSCLQTTEECSLVS